MSQNTDTVVTPTSQDQTYVPPAKDHLGPEHVAERERHPFIPRPLAFARPTKDLLSAQG